jgi:hypothetical protein
MDYKQLYVIALAMIGIGHIIGGMVFLDLWGMSVRSSILDSMVLGQGLIKALSFLWVIPFLAFITSAWGVWAGAIWWETSGWVGTVGSLIYFVLYWNSFPSNIPIQANIGNIVAPAGLLGFINIT